MTLPRDPNRPSHVYRIYDTDGLIYIGSSIRLRTRLGEHKRDSWWSTTAVKVTSQLRPTLASARERELAAILTELPRWNVYDQARLIPTWSEAEVDDYYDRWAINIVQADRWNLLTLGCRPGLHMAFRARRVLLPYLHSRGHAYDLDRAPRLRDLM